MKTAFEILKAKFKFPKSIIIDDADGTRLGKNGIYISDLIEAMEEYAEQFKSQQDSEVTDKDLLLNDFGNYLLRTGLIQSGSSNTIAMYVTDYLTTTKTDL